jgi:hypothetical protein
MLRATQSALFLLVLLSGAPLAHAQDDGPRVYQLQPVGARTFTAFAVVKRGNEAPEPGSFTPGVDTDTNLFVLRYVETFDVAGRAFSPFLILPIGEVDATGSPRSSGFGDAQIGATLGLIGAPALRREAYDVFDPSVVVSLFGRVFFPTGDYSALQPVNLGSNRTALQLGLPTTFAWGRSFRDRSLTTLEVFPSVSFYGDNTDPFAGSRNSKAPLFTVEAHLTRNLSQRVWLSADMLYRNGGETSTDEEDDDNEMRGWSAGGTVALPLGLTSVVVTFEHVIERGDDGPDGWFLRTAFIVPL